MSDPRPSLPSLVGRIGRRGGRRGARPDASLPGFIRSRLEAHPSFTRGLSLGLLVGAAVAGSTIWSRLRGEALRRPPRSGR